MAMMRYAEALNRALREEMQRDSNVFLFGEDIARYGGVFKVTKGLMEEFGESRVRDTPISEQTLAAMAVTASMTGTRPVLEIMYADFMPLVLDALINQASIYEYLWPNVTMPFVLRTQGGGGAGAGAQHSKSLDSLVAHIPGIKVVAPVTPADAKGLLKSAIRDSQPVVFLEHKLLYNLRDEVPDDADFTVPIGKAKTVREGADISIFATSRMVLESQKAAELLAQDGISAEVIDLRTLRPLDLDAITASIAKTHHAVVVNEGWRFCGYAAELSATIMDFAFDDLDAPVARVTLPDMPVPYSEPLELAVLPNAARIADAARATLK
ncbi:alpha-ketoacid dehydrogenase subunit beta [Ancylobacter dichloromethanicus]|uniref:Pyruvate dehydrogenase E1 component subunit beta n=1 Tax=Ancylobacter dichloromethanicus TaxID=518825 RepID=A0A9W6JCD3_9HYPH|nr:alpha-ketoacid dehydrogenase subunit beta [Ancylobacter dichloromethanicus]MBS7553248.1 alpha-ketoacid dehydrogenase subunit beta [Ancylobacter dichloromethanicus]GLK73028.1 pyruvate dehydrogenase E1 component subunit beta [Ancylobacter dichloromethanicus]